MTQDDDDEGRELTAADRRRLRMLLDRDERVQWFWSSMRVWGAWVSASVVAAYGVYQAIRDSGLFKKIGGP